MTLPLPTPERKHWVKRWRWWLVAVGLIAVALVVALNWQPPLNQTERTLLGRWVETGERIYDFRRDRTLRYQLGDGPVQLFDWWVAAEGDVEVLSLEHQLSPGRRLRVLVEDGFRSHAAEFDLRFDGDRALLSYKVPAGPTGELREETVVLKRSDGAEL